MAWFGGLFWSAIVELQFSISDYGWHCSKTLIFGISTTLKKSKISKLLTLTIIRNVFWNTQILGTTCSFRHFLIRGEEWK